MNNVNPASSAKSDRTRGKLKIFLGMCPGVGKTFAMLSEARERLADGVDVMVGYAETHKRAETDALLVGLPTFPRKKVDYRGLIIEELDLDGLLAKRPGLAVVDELPHTNSVGSRHPKRYQDVLELLDAGIDVFTALNVQHIESRVDVVQDIASVKVRETVPDSIVDMADDIQLVDITPEELLARLSEGKVYLGERAANAADNFFKIEHLSALREIAMHVMAQKVGQDVREAMTQRRILGPWKSSERYMVAVGPSPFSEPLIRWTRRIASLAHSSWIAVHVDTFEPISDEAKQRLSRNLSLVRQLGGETVTIIADDVPEALLQTAREQNVTQIVVGKPLDSPIVRLFTGRSLVDKLIVRSGDIDVCVVRADKSNPAKKPKFRRLQTPLPWYRELVLGCSSILAVTTLFWLLRNVVSYSSISLLYLLSIVLLATRLRRRAILVVAALTGILWDFLFIPPVFTFRIDKFNDMLMFGMYFAVALVVAHLTARIRMREIGERTRERRTRVLYQLAQCVVESRTLDEGIRLAVGKVDEVFGCRTAVTLMRHDGTLSDESHPASTWRMSAKEITVPSWVCGSGKPAGRHTDNLPQSEGIHVPLQTTHGCAGVLSLVLPQESTLDVGQRELLDTVADHVAALIDRYNLIRQSTSASLAQESEKLYRVLFDSLSHELKTPIAILTTATSQIRQGLDRGDIHAAQGAQEEASIAIRRLQRTVDNMLGMSRLESGHANSDPHWCDLEEITLAATSQVSDLLNRVRLTTSFADDLPMVRADSVLLTHAVSNLLVNAAQYSAEGSQISVTGNSDATHVVLKVIDHGEGIPADELAGKLFEKFHRGTNAKPGGVGLGLSIVYRFMELAGGTVAAENSSPGPGATFTLTFPRSKEDGKDGV